ncbi:MAG: hypothetical protein IK092_06205, partial [Muribaculaceae bacterium]|nr:hypothetical protein [Muribaculaceae bacterium]
QVKEKDIANLVLSVNEAIDERFMKINKKRQKNIEDSISREKERVRQMEIQDSIVKENEQRRLIKYREQHDWHWLPIRKSDGTTVTLKCALCDKTTSYKDDAFKIITINNDTAYSMEVKSGFLDNVYLVFHCFEIPNELRTSDDYITYKTVFADSLALKPEYNKEFVEQLNNYSFYEYIEQLKKEVPYGFFNSWGWDDEYSTISFNFNYMNLNKRTIKYIDVYWKVTNDVGDVRKTGHFKGTGPLEQYESASWNWDYSSYFVAGDASNMKITKVIITYMNGQQQVLTGNKIKFN